MKRYLICILACLPSIASAQDISEVKMDLAEFLRVYETAKNRPKEPEEVAQPYAISSAHYQGKVHFDENKPESIEFTSRMHVEVLDDRQWRHIPLLPVSVALRSAKINNIEASIIIENGWYTWVTKKKGAVDLDLSFLASVEDYEVAFGTNFELPSSGATELVLTIPSSEDLDVDLANAKIQRESFDKQVYVIQAAIPSTGALSIRWQRKIQAEQALASRVYAQVYTLVGIGDGILQTTTTIDHTILFAGVQELKVQIPAGMTLLDVRGSGIREWKLSDDQVLTVDLNFAAKDSYSLSLDLEKVVGVGDLKLSAPLVVPLGVERSKGWVGVEARGNLEIAALDTVNATPMDVRTLPANILGITQNPILLGYKYLDAATEIPFQINQHADVDVLLTIIDQARATSMFTVDGRRLTSVKYDVRNNRRQFLRLAMPEGAELWSASVAGKAVQPAKASDGQILIPLIRGAQAGGALAAFQVEVVYVEQGKGRNDAGVGTFVAELPIVDAPTTYLGWTVYSPKGAKIGKSSYKGNLRHVSALSFPQAATQVLTLDANTPQYAQSAEHQMAGGSLGQGAEPVQVQLPLDGVPTLFERLLAVDEKLWVSFDYKGLRD